MQIKIAPKNKLQGRVQVPGDKSISHRAIMFGALAKGRTVVRGFLRGEDCLSTVSCFRSLGIEIRDDGELLEITGQGLHGLKEPECLLNTGNSGTTTRLLLGILAGQNFYSVLAGDQSLCSRPMGRVIKPLSAMGAKIYGRQNNTLAPLTVLPAELIPSDYALPVASAQVKSALLLAGMYADGVSSVTEPYLSRDHSERMLRSFGAELETSGLKVQIKGHPKLTGQEITVPGDISSAAFFLVAGAAAEKAEIVLTNVGLNPTRTGIIDVLKAMGADIEILREETIAGEPTGDILVKNSSLHGVNIGGEMIPRLIDEIPILAVAAALADGETVISDAAELRVKETDRIAAVVAELRKMGADITEKPDGMIIRGGQPLHGAECATYHDHRMAMALAVAGLNADGETVINGAECAAVSFPEFFALLKEL
ncbi:MAG: 3-phosphoshikimate 1-carboxyvinyltransferase [bacterium]